MLRAGARSAGEWWGKARFPPESFCGPSYNQVMVLQAQPSPGTGRPRSRLLAIAGWFLLGFAFGMVVIPFPWSVWQDSGIGKRASVAIIGWGFPNLAAYVRTYMLHAPDWVAASLMGLLFGRFKCNGAIPAAVVCAAGLVFGPELWHHKFTFFLRTVESPRYFLLLLVVPKLAAVAFAGCAAMVLVRRRAIPPGHCRACGYDLTGNVSGKCPECALTVSAASAG